MKKRRDAKCKDQIVRKCLEVNPESLPPTRRVRCLRCPAWGKLTLSLQITVEKLKADLVYYPEAVSRVCCRFLSVEYAGQKRACKRQISQRKMPYAADVDIKGSCIGVRK